VRQEDNSISSKKVLLKPLAAPDFLEFDLPDNHCCLISDDGSQLSHDLVFKLQNRGWRVVVMRYYYQHDGFSGTNTTDSADFGQSPVITLVGVEEDVIKQQLDAISASYGPIAVFIHLHPHFSQSPDKPIAFIDNSEKILRQVFLTAKHLHPMMTAAAKQSVSGIRACFMTVTQLDGGFGIRGKYNIDVIAGGLTGLTKTLALEWPEVFCRAVDVNPHIVDKAPAYIMAELFDPNRRIIEVGWSEQGRVTPSVV
jgi:hypothetical protein